MPSTTYTITWRAADGAVLSTSCPWDRADAICAQIARDGGVLLALGAAS